MYLVLQQDEPDDYVISTGVTTEIREFIRMAFSEIGITVEFSGKGNQEEGKIAGIDKQKFQEKTCLKSDHLNKGQVLVKVDPRYFRPTEVDELVGDSSKARKKLGWKPLYKLSDLVKEMVEHDITLFRKDKFLTEQGFNVVDSCEV